MSTQPSRESKLPSSDEFIVRFHYPEELARKLDNPFFYEVLNFSDESLDLTMEDDGSLTIVFDDVRFRLEEVYMATEHVPATYTARKIHD